MHFSPATVALRKQDRPNPIQNALRTITRPLADGLNLGEHLLAGALATASAVASMHPMDTVKTVVQAAGKSSTARPNTLGAAVSVVRTGGIPALYKGLHVSLGGQVPAGAIKFAAYETFTQFVSSIAPDASKAAVDFSCAALAFVVCSVVLVPGELMKQRVQAGIYPGFRAGVRSILKKEGVGALYTGYRATLLRDVPYTMLEFGTYSQLKRGFRAIAKKERLSSREEVCLGGIAGGLTGFFTTPMDLAKTRLMTQGIGATAKYSGVVDVMRKVARTEGTSGLFRGSAARCVWLIPFTAVFFGVHEASKRALMERKLATATAQKSRVP